MTNRPKDIGTRAESAVVKYLAAHGFPHAERAALHGDTDLGDITGCPGLAIEVKGGTRAENCTDADLARWLAETETERRHRHADIGLLVTKRGGRGPDRAGDWWAWLPGPDYITLACTSYSFAAMPELLPPVRITLAQATLLLRLAGYGTPLEPIEVTA